MDARGGGWTCDVFEVPLGWCAAAANAEGICGFVLPVESREAAEAEILGLLKTAPAEGREGGGGKRRAALLLRALRRAVGRYFDGKGAEELADLPVDLSAGTEFQRRVWGAVRRIPYGEVGTYGEIGREIGRVKAFRAVGRAVGTNPLPLLVPCHRVVGSGGALVGFSAAGGVGMKARMLEVEGVRVCARRGGRGRRVLQKGRGIN